jgi:gamma-glutamylcyclotransferase (GGCT)/AIG2-like uncharacterized protein YtfP
VSKVTEVFGLNTMAGLHGLPSDEAAEVGEKTTVFVYGTLLAGYWNHRRCMGSAKLVSKHAVTEGQFQVTDVGYPMAFTRGPDRAQVVGEVYEVDRRTLQQLDDLEGHPRMYRRRQVKVKVASGKTVSAWMYAFDRSPDGGFGDPCSKDYAGRYDWSLDHPKPRQRRCK